MRERDLNNLVPVWNQIIVAFQSTQPDFSIMGLGIMGAFAGRGQIYPSLPADWIDINLVVTEPFIGLLFQIMRTYKDAVPSLGLRNAACDCLNMVRSGVDFHSGVDYFQGHEAA